MRTTSTVRFVPFLALIILFQSCRVYHRPSVPLEDAIKSQKRVKIVTKDDRTLKFKKIVTDESSIYGVKMKDGSEHLTRIKPEDVKSVRLQNQSASIVLSIGAGALVAGLVIVTIAAISWSSGGYTIGPILF